MCRRPNENFLSKEAKRPKKQKSSNTLKDKNFIVCIYFLV